MMPLAFLWLPSTAESQWLGEGTEAKGWGHNGALTGSFSDGPMCLVACDKLPE